MSDHVKKKRSILFVDLVEDKIKSRGIFIAASCLFYIYITYALIIGFERKNNAPSSIELDLSLPRISFIDSNATERLAITATVTNSDGDYLENATVSVQVVKISSDPNDKSAPICDYEYRDSIKGSLEYIRFHDVCKVFLEGYSKQSDSKGKIEFDEFKIVSGPEAYYTFQLVAEVEGYDPVVSEEFSSYVYTTVYELESLNAYYMYKADDINEPLSIQPEVKIKDFNGNPMVNKTVIAFSWVDVYFGSEPGYKNSPSNRKFFALKNVVSQPSDEDGIARFTNLTILGSNEVL